MSRKLKNKLSIFNKYKNEILIFIIVLSWDFQYLLYDTQESLNFFEVKGFLGMWCRIFLCTTNTFWYGIVYWIVFFVFIRGIIIYDTSNISIIRYQSKKNWSVASLKKLIQFACIYAIAHFIWLCIINILLFGWNSYQLERDAFQTIFGLSLESAFVALVGVHLLISTLLAAAVWSVFLMTKHALYSLIGVFIYAVISCIVLLSVPTDIHPYILILPSGVSFSYLLMDYTNNIVLMIGSFFIGQIVFWWLRKIYLPKMEIDKLK